MKLVISPAKSLNYSSELPTKEFTQSCFLKEAEMLNNILKNKSPNDLSKLMSISSSLSDLNYERNQSWKLPFNPTNSRQAIYAFNGDVYKGIDAYSIPIDKINSLQDTVRIISGLYGILKPLDLVQPYRLEMGTKLSFGKNKNLYDYWKVQLTKSINEELCEEELFLNLASNEYIKAIDTKALKTTMITANFKQLKNGEYKTIAIFSKRARGLMARYVIDNKIESVDDLKNFSSDKYRFSDKLSSDNELIFTR
ncbi:peroxide stress protein YaaA [Flavobacteriaceae bacterium]|nr:peroxide stress protein YaaA [Flavobacteriaceae bacterium]MDC1492488.1 peroxide stress protein YaaA [Flavobacteriaceae bacterium]